MSEYIVPAREGRAFDVSQGQQLRITTPHGQQAADFFAYNAHSTDEWLSPNHTWVKTGNVHPRQGDILLSRFRRPMLVFVDDGAGGTHDMMIAACDQFRYEQLGYQGPHASCSENLQVAMRRLGHAIEVVPQPINFFTHTKVEDDGTFVSPPNPVPAGGFVALEALMDLTCVVSSCPFDLSIEGWSINAPTGPTELKVEIS
ncbi:MAG: urea carboxylase-associated family protein [Pseudomonadota bacterium]|nr:urea carboxylase-associated family protein [Pseudomonadota bacterium]